MKNFNFPLSLFSRTMLGFLFLFILTIIPYTSQSQFQHLYGSTTSNSYSTVIPYGSDFYILGDDNGLATITLIDQSGNWVWTTSLNIPSVWSDGVVIPGSGNLLVVGYTLPSDPSNKSLIGEIMPDGTFLCIKSLDGPGNEALNRISPNPGGTYTAVGFHTSGSREVVIYNLSPNCTVNIKKRFFSSNSDYFDNDMEVRSGSGDFLVAGQIGTNAIIYQMSSAGAFVNGVQGPGLFSYIDLEEMSNGDILAAANDTGTNPPRLMRFDMNLFPLWEVSINGVTSLDQVVDGGSGNIFVVGTSTINGLTRAIVVKINDSSGTPVLDWARYLENGETGYTGGGIASLSSGNLAFVDGRDGHANTFGLTDAFMAVTDGDFFSTCSFDEFAFLTFENTLFDGPNEAELVDSIVTPEINLMGQSLDYLIASACSGDTCAVEITYTALDSCGLVQVCANATGPQPYNYQWCGGQSTQCITAQLSCGAQDFCVTVTCSDASTASDSLTINIADTVPPVALCVPGFAIELDANCEYALTPFMIDGGSSDNCQIDSMSVSPQILIGCGFHQVVLTVTDWCGNTSSCTTSIQASEFVPPIIMCPPNITLGCDDDVSPNITGFATATDNCDLNPTITYVDSIFGTLPCDGYIERTWTATDSCDNIASCLQVITIEDDVPPTALCNSGVTVYLGNPCSVTITAAMMDAGSTDNCQLQSLTVSPNIITQCGTPLITLTATDFCGNTSTCQETITVLDTIPPTINCPLDLTATALFPECEVMVFNIQPTSVSDNCTVQSLNYVITGATTNAGGGDASGQLFQEGLSTVSYIANDGCGNVDSCSFVINVECDTCSCLGFTNLYFDNFDPPLQVNCDSASVDLPCIGSDGLYSLQWTLLCSHPLCQQSVDYQIVPASGGPALLSGTAPFPNLTFQYNQLAGQGNYQLILTGNCNGDTCVCVISFSLLDCCDCGSFSGMTYQEAPDSLVLPVMCGDTLAVICDQLSDLEIGGMFQCIGTQCASYPILNWELKDSTNNAIQSGTVQALPGFSLGLMPAWFINPGIYSLTISGQCDGEDCPPCIFYFESEGCLPLPENCCFEWASVTSGYMAIGEEFITDAVGNVYITGRFSGVVDFDPGPNVYNLGSSFYNIFVLKLDSGGNFVWAISFGPGLGIGYSITLDSAGDIYVAGYFQGTCDFDPGPNVFNLTATTTQDAFLLKLDTAGQIIWAKQLRNLTSGTGLNIRSITIDGQGNIYTTGYFQGATDFDMGPGVFILAPIGGQTSCFVSKLDNNGNFLWAKQLEGTNPSFSGSQALSVDAANNVYVIGRFQHTIDFDPAITVFNMTTFGSFNIYILKLDPIGNFIWAKQIEGNSASSSHTLGTSIKIDSGGDVIASGYFELSADFDPGPNIYNLTASSINDAFILKLDGNGDFVWAKQIGGTGRTSSNGLTFDANGNIYTNGGFLSTVDFDPGPNVFSLSSGNGDNAFILKLDQQGNFVWVKDFQSSGYSAGNGIAISTNNDIYSIGFFHGLVDFDTGLPVHNLWSGSSSSLFVHKLNTCPPDSCRSPVFSIQQLDTCKYRFQVETVDDCYSFLKLQLDTSMFIDWIVDSGNGWIAEQLSATEILLTHSSGSIPLGASAPITFNLFPGLQPNMNIEWENSCDSVDGCASSFLLAGCHNGCTCGSFSDMFIRSPQDTINLPFTCGGPPLNIGCPIPGVGYVLTGSLLCQGDSCLTEVDLDWSVLEPFGGLVASGTHQAAPWFTLPLPSSYFVQAGVYTLVLNGHCGSTTCPSIIEFMVEEGCPDPCPCDLMDLEADVNQGFASSLWDTNCNGCFSPVSLNDCDEVEWYVDDPNGTPIGSSIGNQSFCYTFSSVGTYMIYMTVIRKRADGSLCESAFKWQTVNVTCQTTFDCDDSVLSNSDFSEGSLVGSLNDTGNSDGWSAPVGNPTVIEGAGGSNDGWTIQLTGNYDGADVLSIMEPICLEKDTGTVTLRLYTDPIPGAPQISASGRGKPRLAIEFHQEELAELFTCQSESCFSLASIDVEPFDSGWVNLEVPYDLRDWDVPSLCNGVLVRPVVYVTNSYGDGQGGADTLARLQLDNFCLDGVLVGTNNVTQQNEITLFPNPTTGQVTLRFENKIPNHGELQVLDIWGRTVQMESLIPGAREHTLDLKDLPTSVYILKVLDDGESVWLKKLILL